jgi:hypothetical protein
MRTAGPIAREITRHAIIQMDSAPPAACEPLASCDHLHESTSRYDRAAKQLTFLLVCPVCQAEKVIETHHYEARFEPHDAAAPSAGGATVHQLPVRAQSTRPASLAA